MRSSLASTGALRPVPGTSNDLSAALQPRDVELLHRVTSDLEIGVPVLIRDGATTVLIALAEPLTDDRHAAIAALGPVELAVTRRRAAAMGASLPGGTGAVRLPVPGDAGLDWIAAVAGLRGPEAGLPATAAPQAGTPVQDAAVALAGSMQALPAVLSVALPPAVPQGGLTAMPLGALRSAMQRTRPHRSVSSARLPMDASAAGRVHVFRPDDGGAEHYAIEIGTPDLAQCVTVRLHSACFTGDVLGSRKCDCGPQLRAAMAAMAASGGGVLLYLNQEGRGIGLANKMRAYALQDAGLDTVEANHWLGFEDDQRDFRIGAQILRRLGIARVRLMTNNPAKVASLAAHDIAVQDRVPLRVGHTAQNAHYLATKAAKSGHLL